MSESGSIRLPRRSDYPRYRLIKQVNTKGRMIFASGWGLSCETCFWGERTHLHYASGGCNCCGQSVTRVESFHFVYIGKQLKPLIVKLSSNATYQLFHQSNDGKLIECGTSVTIERNGGRRRGRLDVKFHELKSQCSMATPPKMLTRQVLAFNLADIFHVPKSELELVFPHVDDVG